MSTEQAVSAGQPTPTAQTTNGAAGPRPVRRLVELRVHGVHGTTPATMLDDPFPVQVDGDDVAQFFRSRATVGAAPLPDRLVEAFYWGRFTAGSPSRALWLVLAPFAILNLARYALLLPTGPHYPGRRRWSAHLADAVFRLLGLVLTLVLVVNVAFVSLNVLAHQCGSYPACLRDNGWLAVVGGWPLGGRLLAGCLLPLVVIVMLWWFGRQTFLYEPRGNRPDMPNRDRIGGLGDRAFWYSPPQVPPLRALHVAAACTVLGLLLAGVGDGPGGEPVGVTDWSVLIGWVLGGAAVLGTALVPLLERNVAAPHDPVQVSPAVQGLRWISVLYLAAMGGWMVERTWVPFPAPVGARWAQPLPGFEIAANAGSAAMAGLLLVLVLVCGWMRWCTGDGRRLTSRARVPAAFRPAWQGSGAIVLATLALLLATGLSSGLAFWSAEVVGEPVVEQGVVTRSGRVPEWGIALGPSYWSGVGLWGLVTVTFLLILPALTSHLLRLPVWVSLPLLAAGITGGAALAAVRLGLTPLDHITAVAAAVLVVAAVLAAVVAWLRDPTPDEVRKAYHHLSQQPTLDTDLAPRGISKVVLAWRLGRVKERVHWVIGVVALLGVAHILLAAVLVLYRMPADVRTAVGAPALPEPALEFLSSFGAIGATVVTGLVALLITLGMRSWRNQKLRTGVGVLWDLLSFWPRLAHPICPPPYGGRTALELVERVRAISTSPAAANGGRSPVVVLSGHSQGSLVCAAAVALLAEDARLERAGGNPAGPATETLHSVGLLTYGSQLHWAYSRLFPAYVGYRQLRRIYRMDLKGRWWNLYRRTDPLGGPVLGLDPARFSAAQDVQLLDPERIVRVPDRPLSPLRGHSDYYLDGTFAGHVNDVVRALRV
jgi:hypothetical protein